MTAEQAMVAFARAVRAPLFKHFVDSDHIRDEVILAICPEEARRVLLDENDDAALASDLRWCAGRAEGRREMAEECEKLVLDDARYGNYMRDGRKLIAEYIRALAARDEGSRGSSPGEPLACTEKGVGSNPAPGSNVTMAGSGSKGPIDNELAGGAVVPTKATAEPAATLGGAASQGATAAPSAASDPAPAGARDLLLPMCDEHARLVPCHKCGRGVPPWGQAPICNLCEEETIARHSMAAARAVRDAIARLWPGLEAQEVMTDDQLAAILRAGEET